MLSGILGQALLGMSYPWEYTKPREVDVTQLGTWGLSWEHIENTRLSSS